MTEHPITPPPELVQQWFTEGHHQDYCSSTTYAIQQAARWGADTELEACRLWVSEVHSIYDAAELLNQRRPKPPSLKEQALNVLKNADGADHPIPVLVLPGDEADIIRQALETLPND